MTRFAGLRADSLFVLLVTRVEGSVKKKGPVVFCFSTLRNMICAVLGCCGTEQDFYRRLDLGTIRNLLCTNGVLGSPTGLVLGRDRGGCPPYVPPRSLFSSLSGPQAATFNIISLHLQLPPCLLGRLNNQQHQPLHLTVSVS